MVRGKKAGRRKDSQKKPKKIKGKKLGIQMSRRTPFLS